MTEDADLKAEARLRVFICASDFDSFRANSMALRLRPSNIDVLSTWHEQGESLDSADRARLLPDADMVIVLRGAGEQGHIFYEVGTASALGASVVWVGSEGSAPAFVRSVVAKFVKDDEEAIDLLNLVQDAKVFVEDRKVRTESCPIRVGMLKERIDATVEERLDSFDGCEVGEAILALEEEALEAAQVMIEAPQCPDEAWVDLAGTIITSMLAVRLLENAAQRGDEDEPAEAEDGCGECASCLAAKKRKEKLLN